MIMTDRHGIGLSVCIFGEHLINLSCEMENV